VNRIQPHAVSSWRTEQHGARQHQPAIARNIEKSSLTANRARDCKTLAATMNRARTRASDALVQPKGIVMSCVQTHFGKCPHCATSDGWLNVQSDHWFICRTHRVKWYGGSNLLSSWRDEDESTWSANARALEDFTEVESVHPRVVQQPGLRDGGLQAADDAPPF
jgi:hypothetical protein